MCLFSQRIAKNLTSPLDSIFMNFTCKYNIQHEYYMFQFYVCSNVHLCLHQAPLTMHMIEGIASFH